MPDITLTDEKLDIYQSYIRPVTLVNGLCETIIDMENKLFNETLKDFLRRKSLLRQKIEHGQIYDFVNELDQEAHDAVNCGIEPTRFDPQAIVQAFKSLSVYFLDEFEYTGAASYKPHKTCVYSIPTRKLSFVERRLLTTKFNAEYEIGSKLLGWKYAHVQFEEGITQDDINSWITTQYKEYAWLELEALLRAGNYKGPVLPLWLSLKKIIKPILKSVLVTRAEC